MKFLKQQTSPQSLSLVQQFLFNLKLSGEHISRTSPYSWKAHVSHFRVCFTHGLHFNPHYKSLDPCSQHKQKQRDKQINYSQWKGKQLGSNYPKLCLFVRLLCTIIDAEEQHRTNELSPILTQYYEASPTSQQKMSLSLLTKIQLHADARNIIKPAVSHAIPTSLKPYASKGYLHIHYSKSTSFNPLACLWSMYLCLPKYRD